MVVDFLLIKLLCVCVCVCVCVIHVVSVLAGEGVGTDLLGCLNFLRFLSGA